MHSQSLDYYSNTLNMPLKEYLDNVYELSIFTSKERMEAFLRIPSKETFAKMINYAAIRFIDCTLFFIRQQN